MGEPRSIGLVDQTTVTQALVGVTPGAEDLELLKQIPGTFRSAAWRKGVGIAPTDEKLAEIAAYLLSIGS